MKPEQDNKPKRPRPKLVYNFPCPTCHGNRSCTIEYKGGLTYHGVCPTCEGSGLRDLDRVQHDREGYFDRGLF